MALENVIDLWQRDLDISNNIAKWYSTPSNEAVWSKYPDELHDLIKKALQKSSIDQLYSHQCEAWQYVQAGSNVVVTTGTASGKSLCYNLPILNDLLWKRDCNALYLFPTKALAADQYNALKNICDDIKENDSESILVEGFPWLAVYDGDTQQSVRSKIRRNSKIVLSNPDMLHLAIMPNHTKWEKFFRKLSYIVLDEIHIYRGVFGSHVANVIRRLKRVAKFYGSNPKFIMTSATISNPKTFAEKLIQNEVIVVDRNGAPKGASHFILYNPPLIKPELGLRQSASMEGARLVEDLLHNKVQTLMFSKSRRSVEITLKRLRERVGGKADQLLQGYRSGYLASDRRRIEEDLRKGKAKVVVATNALELGVDIGGMGAVVMIGYPGTIAAVRQQAGRAGRQQDDSLAVMVASSAPIDQFLINHSEYLFSRASEQALINPDNLLILMEHIKCTIFELPLKQGEAFGQLSLDLLSDLLVLLAQSGVIYAAGDKYYWSEDSYPADNISLRNLSGGSILLQLVSGDGAGAVQTIGEIDRQSAYWMVHPGALYIHSGNSYLVEELDLVENVAKLVSVDVDYYTEAKKSIELDIVSIDRLESIYGGKKYYGEISVTSQVTGYKRIHWSTRELLGVEELEMPVTQLHTSAFGLMISETIVNDLRVSGLWTSDPNIYGPNWKEQRQKARQRDRYICQVCGKVEGEQQHHVHHIVPFRNFQSAVHANELSNLVTLCPTCHKQVELNVKMKSGLSGLGHIIHNLAPLFLMCDVTDLNLYIDPQMPIEEKKIPVVMLYETMPAGVGLCEELYGLHEQLLSRAFDLINTCSCEDGCPSCVGPSGENGIGGKKETLAILEKLLNYSSGSNEYGY